jgi:nucleosome binding factor SPN SPT16 subunit
LASAIKKSGSGKTVGVLVKDLKFPGAFMDAWRSYWAKAGAGSVKNVDVTAAVAAAMAPKEESELAAIRKASQVTSEVFSKYLKEQIMDIIDNDKVRTNLLRQLTSW